MTQFNKQVNNKAITKPDQFVLELYSLNLQVYMSEYFLMSLYDTDTSHWGCKSFFY